MPFVFPFPFVRVFGPVFVPGTGFTGAAVVAFGSDSGVIVGGSFVGGVVAVVIVEGGEAVVVTVALTPGFVPVFEASVFAPRIPRYTLTAATTTTSAAITAMSGAELFAGGGGKATAGGRSESGTRMPAAFVIDARTPLESAPCASSAARS